MRYYLADNKYGTETSVGFANTWFVLAFSSKKARDNYLEETKSLAARTISRDQVTSYIEGSPAPFSFEHYGIVERYDLTKEYLEEEDQEWDWRDGLIGEVTIVKDYNGYPELEIERLN